MYNFIKKIKENKVDGEVHKKFVRFGLGTYEREAFTIALTAKKINLKAGFEYVDVLLKFLADLLTENVELSGAIVTSNKGVVDILKEYGVTFDSRGKKYTIKSSMTAVKFKEFLYKLDGMIALLVIKSGEYKVGLKKSPPKPGKLVEDFMKVQLPLSDLGKIIDEFIWEADQFKKAEVRHTVTVEDIKVPKEFEHDHALARVNAIRKGKILRVINIDGTEKKSEFEFAV